MEAAIKLFATDMDGTFLHSDRSYDKARLARLLKLFTARELIFCAASGRQLLALEKMFADFKDKMAFVAENGAVVKFQGEIVYAATLTKEELTALFFFFLHNPYMTEDKILLSGARGAYALETTKESFYQKTKLYYENVKRVQSVADIQDEIFKLTTNFPREHTLDCERWLNEQAPYVHATTTGFESIDVIPLGVNKATGLRQLADRLHISADQVCAFGDQLNDLEMMTYAGRSVAVSNALSEVKALASYEIGSNDEDAVLTEIEKLISH
jgi:Cof subfamily protein (haloacid dehalogenase superfamily)